MRLTKYTLILLSGVAFISVGMQGAFAAVIPGSAELSKYLVIATGEGTSGSKFEAFNMSNVEIGADQEIVSNSQVGDPGALVGSGNQRVGGVVGYKGGLDLTGTFVPNDEANAVPSGNRWDDLDPDHSNNDTVGIPDRLPGARPIFEGVDFSGNVAITGGNSNFNASNTDTNATTGIQCGSSPTECMPSPSSNNTYFDDSAPNTALDLNLRTPATGISQFTTADLLAMDTSLAATRDFIVGLIAETTFSSSAFDPVSGLPFTTGEGLSSFDSAFVNRNIKDANTTVITDLDAIDTNNDGFAVIDIDTDGIEFAINNTDWILQSAIDIITGASKTMAIFRLVDDSTHFKFANSSILLGDGTVASTNVIDELGAIFFTDALKGTNAVIDLSNVILGGIGLWDFTDFNPNLNTRLSSAASVRTSRPGDLSLINMQDAQGCAQFISHEVLMSNNRWNRCAQQVASVPEPSAWLLFGFGLIGIEVIRRARRVKYRAAA